MHPALAKEMWKVFDMTTSSFAEAPCLRITDVNYELHGPQQQNTQQSMQASMQQKTQQDGR